MASPIGKSRDRAFGERSALEGHYAYLICGIPDHSIPPGASNLPSLKKVKNYAIVRPVVPPFSDTDGSFCFA